MSMAAIFAEGGAGRANFLKQIGFDLFVINHFFFTMYYGFKISITDPEVSIFEGGTPDQWAMAAWKCGAAPAAPASATSGARAPPASTAG